MLNHRPAIYSHETEKLKDDDQIKKKKKEKKKKKKGLLLEISPLQMRRLYRVTK